MDEPDDIARRQPDALVDRIVKPPVPFGHPPDREASGGRPFAPSRLGAAHVLCIAADDIDRAIRRSAIDDDVFEVVSVPFLPCDGRQCHTDRLRTIPDDRDD